MSDQSAIEPPDNALPFRRIADRIDLNRGDGFAGAFVFVPPDGEPHELLLLDRNANPVIFWSSLKTRVDIALAQLEATERQGNFGGRR